MIPLHRNGIVYSLSEEVVCQQFNNLFEMLEKSNTSSIFP